MQGGVRVQPGGKAQGCGILDRLGPAFLLLGTLFSTIGFLLAFTTAPLVLGAGSSAPALIGGQMVANKLLLSQKIFYFHVPVALASFIALGFTAYFGIRYLTSRDAAFDLRSKLATELALVFILMTMASGEMWERYEWGIWWTWDPRLTTYFIMMLLVIGYFVLRNAIDDAERRASYAAVFGILACIDAPISFLITRLVPTSIHPVVFRTDSGLPPAMLLPFLLALAGMLMIGFGLFRWRLREQLLRQRVEALLAELED